MVYLTIESPNKYLRYSRTSRRLFAGLFSPHQIPSLNARYKAKCPAQGRVRHAKRRRENRYFHLLNYPLPLGSLFVLGYWGYLYLSWLVSVELFPIYAHNSYLRPKSPALFCKHEGPIYQYGGLVITQFTLSAGSVLRTLTASPQITVLIFS